MSGLQVRYDSQIPRNSLFLLLLAQFVLIVPYVPLLPFWLSLCCVACGVWRIQVYRGQWPFANLWQRTLLVLAALVGVSASYFQQLGIDAIIAFLLLIFFLKLLETRRARDVYVTLFLGYFIAATRLMHDSSLLALVYAVCSYLMLSLALLALHQRGPVSLKQSLVYTGRLSVQGLPVLLLLFVLFPRLDPLWKAQPPQGQVRAGVSDHIALGAFGELAQSAEVAFRVSFDRRMPPVSALYWRGLVFEEYDGDSWRVSAAAQAPVAKVAFAQESFADGEQAVASGLPTELINYRVLLEPGHQRWLFALPLARAAGGGTLVHTEARTLRLQDIPQGRYQYRVSSLSGAMLQAQLPAAVRERNLALPARGNERARAFGRDLRERYQKPQRIAAVMMDQFRRERYFYTLQPPVFANDSIDGFLLDSKRGYCEHYASAFVFVMRAAGVPARLVGGYLGGESNPFDDYLAVRQMDAHAWAEVWHQGRGWVRYDPTAMVAPERVLDGVEAVLRQRDEYAPGGLLGLAMHPGLQWLQGARLWWDAVGFGWARWVLNYDRTAQQRLLQSWFGRGDWVFLLRLLAGSLAVVLVLATLWLLRGGVWGHRYSGPQRAALLFSWLLGLLGSQRKPSESMLMYCARVAERYPVLAPTLAEFAACWSALSYAQLQYPWKRRLRLYAQLLRLARQVVAIRWCQWGHPLVRRSP